MKAPTSLFDRPGRATAVVGAVIAVSATAAVALLSGTATATPGTEQPGRCTKNVNVRAEPDTSSRIVALCEEGTAVKVGEARDGFLRLTNLGGWAAQEYVSVNGRAPAPAARATNSEDDDTEDADDTEEADDRRASRSTDDARENRRAGRHGTDGSDSTGSGDGRSGANDSSADESRDSTDPEETDESEDSDIPGQNQAPRPGGLGGLLG